ncbi:hypothetical protein [Photobacterium lutimaris]|uniref:Uncharacterized protein n=1 Tax=Photobacterium lutimaris TaxID=388278 RepID=A0A2T3IZM7_9GAMM|nr:hypothetical protein [Photobacterium lutimaris]PSU34146.1 hypothetical protein C9I99_09130 [Photobacterium lutimaris]TDR75719.1 hypothetical protein DFP78_10476 [Photobacterium lutimaris]
MSKILLFIGENEQFDKEEVVKSIRSINGVENAKEGDFIGAAFEAEYKVDSESYIIRLSDDLETITIDGMDNNCLNFILSLKGMMKDSFQAVDMDYSFHVDLSIINTIEQFKQEIQKGI